MPPADPRKLAQAERIRSRSLRACAAGIAFAIVAVVLAILDMGGGDRTLLAAIGFFICFLGVTLALSGLFGLALSRETPEVTAAPAWAVPGSVAAVLVSIASGLFGLLT